MRRLLPLFLVLLLCMAVCLSACDNTAANKGRAINSVNHRGYSAEAPENTLAAYRLSKEKGFTMVECDITFTADGVPVLLHDDTINRTSDGSGLIRGINYQDVLQYDFGSWKNAKYADEKIPTLQQFLQLCKDLELYPYLEVKNGATKQEVALIAKMVRDSGMPHTWIARDINILSQLSEVFEKGRFGLIVDVITNDNIRSITGISTEENEVFMDVNYFFLTSAQINSCKKADLPMEIWTLNKEKQIANVDPYVSGVTSDWINAEELFKTL